MEANNIKNLEAEKTLISALFQLSDFDNWETPEEVFKIDEKLFTDFRPVFKALKENGFSEAWKSIAKGKIILNQEKERDDIQDHYINYLSGGTSRESIVEELKKLLISLKETAIERENKDIQERIKGENAKTTETIYKRFEERKNNIRVWDEEEVINNDPVNNIINRIDGAEEDQNKKYLFGLSKFDEYIQFRPGQINIIGARPSVGKSLLALNLAMRNVSKGLNVGYISLEMGEEQVLTRIYSILSWIPLKTLMGKVEDEGTRAKISKAIDDFQEVRESKRFLFSEKYAIKDLIKQIRLWKKHYWTQIFYIDHIGLLRGDKTKQRYIEIGGMLEDLKHLAEELKITIVLLSQLNRQTNVNDYWERPQLIHLSESGNLEQIWSIIILLYRDFREESEDPERMEILIRKNRDGKVGEFEIKVEPAFMRISEYKYNTGN